MPDYVEKALLQHGLAEAYLRLAAQGPMTTFTDAVPLLACGRQLAATRPAGQLGPEARNRDKVRLDEALRHNSQGHFC